VGARDVPTDSRRQAIVSFQKNVQDAGVTIRQDGEAMVKLKRVYDPVSRTDGTRFLVERLWPRGLSKERLHLTAWLKEVGPSTELRQWFNHDPLKWGISVSSTHSRSPGGLSSPRQDGAR
jgi:hypothetical protein